MVQQGACRGRALRSGSSHPRAAQFLRIEACPRKHFSGCCLEAPRFYRALVIAKQSACRTLQRRHATCCGAASTWQIAPGTVIESEASMSALQPHCANPANAARTLAGSHELSAGWLACDRYRVERLVAWGGMGLVYQATHLALDVTVALKVLRPEFGDCEERVAAFLDEAHWLAALSSDHIVRILDAGHLDSGLPFLAMELLEGRDLRCVLQACGRMAPAMVVEYALQACSALGEVHDLGLVHCDVKPSNLFLAAGRHASARIKLLDFGIARSRVERERGQYWSSPD
jgi:hypothetical protein